MSLYNVLFGENEDATALIGMIELTRNSFGRYRDVYLNKEGNIITVISRIGGGNKKEFRQIYTNIKRNPYFLEFYEDNFDDTYVYFKFKVPEKYKDTCKKIAPKEDRLSVSDMFKKEIEDSKIEGSDASKRMEMIASYIMDNIENGNNIIEL